MPIHNINYIIASNIKSPYTPKNQVINQNFSTIGSKKWKLNLKEILKEEIKDSSKNNKNSKNY